MKKLLAVLILFVCGGVAQAAIKISPSYLELDANKTKKDYVTGSFLVAGGRDETVRFKVYPVFFEYDNKGHFVELPDNNQKNSLMGKVKFFPQEFTCINGLEQKIRITVTDLKSLPAGDSRLTLFLEDIDTKEVVIQRSNGSIGGKIIVKTRVGVPIYVAKGNYTRKGNFEALVLKNAGEDYICEYKVASLGNSKIRYNGTAYLSQGDKLIKQMDIHGKTVEGGKFVEMVQKLDLPKEQLNQGEQYNLKVVLTYKDEKNNDKVIKKDITFIPNKVTPTKV